MRIMQTPGGIALVSLPAAALCLMLARPSLSLHAQSAAPGKATKSVSCTAAKSKWLEEPRIAQLYNGVVFGQDDETLKTDTVVALFDKDHNIVSAKSQGSVHLYDLQNDLTGQHGSVDFTKHLAMLSDSIVLVVKPGKRQANVRSGSPVKQFKDPATLTCQAMTYDYRFKIGRIPGPLTVTQVIQTKNDGPRTRVLTADAGLYNGRAETIQLVGTIRGTYSDGSVIEGDTRTLGQPMIISIKEGSESIFAPFKMTSHFTVKNQTDSGSDSKDDEPDLTLPAPPVHTPLPGDTASPQPPVTPLPAPDTASVPPAAAGTP